VSPAIQINRFWNFFKVSKTQTARQKVFLLRRSVRETQEGCPSPLKSIVFEAFSKLQKLRQRGEKTFSTR
jgi:hypothetical protein